MFDYELFQINNRERAAQWHESGPKWTPDKWNTAFIGEYGEAMNVLKKINRIRDGIPGRKTETDTMELGMQLMYELADAFTYFDLLTESCEQMTGLDLGDFIVSKFNQVSQQYGFSQRLANGTVEDDNQPPISMEHLNDNNPCGKVYLETKVTTVDGITQHVNKELLDDACACGCRGDDFRCAYYMATYSFTDEQVRPSHTCCNIPGR
jgi:hypothetical protein